MITDRAIHNIDVAIEQALKDKELAGLNMAVVHKGKEIYYHEAGYSNIDMKKAMKRDTIFRLYSMTKPVTAAACMILVEEGKIDLFDPVSLYLPGFKDQSVLEDGKEVPVYRDMCIMDLLNMTSGLLYPGEGEVQKSVNEVFGEIDRRLNTDEEMSTVDIANALGQGMLSYQPGASWSYGTSADIIGALIEVVSGVSLGMFLKERIFKPLGMVDTDFYVPMNKQDRLATVYASVNPSDGKPFLDVYDGHNLGIYYPMDHQPAFESGGAGLASTIDDYKKFAGMLMNGGVYNGVRILQSKTVDYLVNHQLTSDQQSAFDWWHTLAGHTYGNFMRVANAPEKAGCLVSPMEYGWDGWLGCYMTNMPKDDLTILIMMQKKDAGTTSLTRKIRNIVLSDII